MQKVLDSFLLEHVRAAYVSIVGNMGSMIEFKDIGRDGGGSKLRILASEVGGMFRPVYGGCMTLKFGGFFLAGYHVLLRLSLLYGDALSRAPYSVSRFIVRTGPLLWKLREDMRDYLAKKQNRANVRDAGIGTLPYECKRVWPGPYECKDEKKRELYSYQREDIDNIEVDLDQGLNGHFVKEPTGAGKTRVSVEVALALWRRNQLPRHTLVAVPPTAVDAAVREWQNMGFTVRRLWANAKPPREKDPWRKLCQGPKDVTLRPGIVYLVEHDFLRRPHISEELMQKAPETFLIIDEADLTLRASQRTAHAQQLQRLAAHFLLMTATAFLSRDRGALIPYLSSIVRFPVTRQNVLVAVGAMKSSDFKYDIKIDRRLVHCEWRDAAQQARFLKYARAGPQRDGHKALSIAYERTAECMAADMSRRLREPDCSGIMFDACSAAHQQQQRQAFLRAHAVEDKKLFVLESRNVVELTTENVQAGCVPNYDAAIVTAGNSRSFPMTKFHDYWHSPLRSSLNTRVQLLGRLYRKQQASKVIHERVYVVGPLEMMLEDHDATQSLETIMDRHIKLLSAAEREGSAAHPL